MSKDSKVIPELFELLSLMNENRQSLAPELRTSLDSLNEMASVVGRQLFVLNKFEEAEHYLSMAAAAGHGWPAFGMATCSAYRDGIWYGLDGRMASRASDETKRWLKIAANQNYIPALIQLGDPESIEKAKGLINQGVVEKPLASYYMYLITDEVTYLQQAATEGSDLAKFKLAQLYQQAPGIMGNAALRTARIEELLQEAADAGLPMAVYARVFSAESTADASEKQARLAQLAWLGQVEGMLEYGYALANMPRSRQLSPGQYEDGHQIPHTYGLARDLGVAHALLNFVLKNTPQAPTLAADVHFIETRMTDMDRQRSDATDRQLADKQVRPFYRLEELIIPGTAN
jgi:TPR repeat protein